MDTDPGMQDALLLANALWHLAGTLCGTIVQALADNKISVFEGLHLGLQAVQLGTSLAETIQDGGAELHAHLLYVCEHALLVLPEGA